MLLLTDHKPLYNAFHSLTLAESEKQQTTSFTEYITDTEHIKGQQNIVADCLSQPTLAIDINLCDPPAIADAQVVDA